MKRLENSLRVQWAEYRSVVVCSSDSATRPATAPQIFRHTGERFCHTCTEAGCRLSSVRVALYFVCGNLQPVWDAAPLASVTTPFPPDARSIDRSPGFIPCFTESWLWDSRLEVVGSHMIRDPWAFRSGLRHEITSVVRILTAIALILLRSCISHRSEPERLQEQDSSFRSSSAAPLVEVCDSNLYELRKTLQTYFYPYPSIYRFLWKWSCTVWNHRSLGNCQKCREILELMPWTLTKA